MKIDMETRTPETLHHAYREVMRDLPFQGTINVLEYTPWDLHRAWLAFSQCEEDGEFMTLHEMWFMEAWLAFCRAAASGKTWRELRKEIARSANIFFEWEVR